MGGYGSGPQCGTGYAQAEECARLDATILRGLMQSEGVHYVKPQGWTGSLEMYLGDAPRYRISYSVYGQHMYVTGPMLSTRPNYGGVRWWWACPRCERRTRVLYLPGGAYQFACRRCYNLRYGVQRLTASQRLLERSRHLYSRAGSSDGGASFIYKPKGMHWRTFDRLCDEAEEALRRSFHISTEAFVRRFEPQMEWN